jgi:hypothetical protein
MLSEIKHKTTKTEQVRALGYRAFMVNNCLINKKREADYCFPLYFRKKAE